MLFRGPQNHFIKGLWHRILGLYGLTAIGFGAAGATYMFMAIGPDQDVDAYGYVAGGSIVIAATTGIADIGDNK